LEEYRPEIVCIKGMDNIVACISVRLEYNDTNRSRNSQSHVHMIVPSKLFNSYIDKTYQSKGISFQTSSVPTSSVGRESSMNHVTTVTVQNEPATQ
jgi:hypothetical protein